MSVKNGKIFLLSFLFIFLRCENSILKWNLPELASVETSVPEKISNTSVRCGGNVTNDGGSSVTEKGICYNTVSHPTVEDNKVIGGDGKGSFTVRIDGLKPGTNYYFRAYAITQTGISYGNETSVKTGTLPFLTTIAATSVTAATAVIGGTITVVDSSKILERGICYGTEPNPVITGNKILSSSDSSNFSVSIQGLLQGTTYYARAFATIASGTAYGNEISFTTASILLPVLTTAAVSSITHNSAISGGNITSDGGGPVTERGVCYNTSPNPTVINDKVVSGNGTGIFTSALINLNSGITYYVRAYATNSAGTAYGNEISFTTKSLVVPTLTTAAAASITVSSAVSGGDVTSDGGSPVTERGICVSTSTDPTVSDNKITAGTGNGNYVVTITGLIPGTSYFVRAYAINSAGVAYGNQITFVTSSIFLPLLGTITATSVTENSAVSGGNITYDGGAAITERGICFSTNPTPTTTDQKVSGGSGAGDFSVTLSGLNPGTTYYVRAYAVNSAGTAYGNPVSFTTSVSIQIGSAYEGGIIFYVDQTGKHGLIAAPSDQSSDAQWGCSGKSISSSEATSLGSGSLNTLAIVNNCSDSGTAARICYDLSLNGYNDWYLPSKNELNLIYLNLKKNGKGGLSDNEYWSSSQDTNKNSWLQSFASGKVSAKNKNTSVSVRAIRSF